MLRKYISWAKAKLSLEKDEITGDYVYGSLMRQFHDLKDKYPQYFKNPVKAMGSDISKWWSNHPQTRFLLTTIAVVFVATTATIVSAFFSTKILLFFGKGWLW